MVSYREKLSERYPPRPLWRLGDGYWRRLWQQRGVLPTESERLVIPDAIRAQLIAGGERGGKSWTSGNKLLGWSWCHWPRLFWIVGPDYEQARAEFDAWLEGAVLTQLVIPESVSTPRMGPWRAETIWGAEVRTRSSTKEATLAGRAPDAIVMAEAAQQSYLAFLRCRGRVAEKRGPLLLSGTFEGGKNWYSDLYESWQAPNVDGGRSYSLPSWGNTFVYPGGREDPEIKALERTYPADVFQERFGAIPCPPATLVFKEFSHVDHVVSCPFDPDLPVQLWIDPGYAGAYAVVVVQFSQDKTPREVYQIDEVYWTQRTVQEVILECKQREWWPKVHHCVIDVAGRQHPGMESHAEAWHRLAGLPVSANPVGIPDGILRHRTFLRHPGSRPPRSRLFHDPRCTGTIAEYGKYKYHEIKENRPVRELPIDADNHAMKAIAYGLVANFGFVAPPQLQPMRVTWRKN